MVEIDQIAGPVGCPQQPARGALGDSAADGPAVEGQNGAENIQGVDQLQIGGGPPPGEGQQTDKSVRTGEEESGGGEKGAVFLQQGGKAVVVGSDTAAGEKIRSEYRKEPPGRTICRMELKCMELSQVRPMARGIRRAG